MYTRLKEWMITHAESPWVKGWLFFFSFIESAFFPIPVEVFLAPVLLARPRKWFSNAVLASVASVLGGVAGYLIGFWLFDIAGQPIIDFYGLGPEFAGVAGVFAKGAFIAIFIAAFTPIPYKVFTIAAGVFGINFVVFLLASVVGRFLRLTLASWLIARFGKPVFEIAYRHLKLITALIVLAFLAWLIVLAF